MFRIVRLDRLQEGAGFEEEYLAGCLLSRLSGSGAADGLPDADLIVYSCDTPDLPPAIREVVDASTRPILLHLSNESLQHDYRSYAKARWVFRSYYDPNCALPNVSTVPLGYRSGFEAAAKARRRDMRKTEYIWAFAGQKKSDRKTMAERMESLAPHFAHYTSGWLSTDMLTVEQMCDVYAQTQVVPCPMGNINPDSFRVMEALENGCIPVVKKFYGYDIMKYTFGDHPFIVGASWADCARAVRRLRNDPEGYRARAEATARWYRQFKETLAEDVGRIVRDGAAARCEGAQFAYQREGKTDMALKAAFAWHFREKYRLVHRLRRIGGIFGGGPRRPGTDAT